MHRSLACIPHHGASALGFEEEQKLHVKLSVYCAHKCDERKDCAGFLFRDDDTPFRHGTNMAGGTCWLYSSVTETKCWGVPDLRLHADKYTTYVRDKQ